MRTLDQSVVWRCAAAIAAVVACATGALCFGGDVKYDIRFLLPPPEITPSFNTAPMAINNSGVIVGGNAGFSSVDSPALRWDPGATVATRLTGLGGVNVFGKIQDAAVGINDNGAIVGCGMTPTGNSRHALRWDPGATVPTDISGGDSDSEAFAINIAGAAVGQGSSYAHPVYWAPGATTFTILPAGTFNSGTVWAINDAGVLAGQVLGNPTQWAAKWSPPYTSFTYLPFLPGKPVTQSTDINASGTVVGYVSLDASQTHHGFRYDPASDTVSELLGRPGVDPIHNVNILAKAVNGEGVSVGIAGPQYHEHAVMWLPGSTDAVDMNSLIDPASGWVLIDAWDINNAGQIIGQALSSNGSGFYVLTPVPEPTFLGSSLGMVLALTAARFCARGADAARCQTGRSGRGRCAPLS